MTIRVELLAPISWRELVRFAEDQASSEIWSSLKRADEKWITERAYENPKFVEDMVRDVALALNADARVGRYTVDVENFESIHAHSAVARSRAIERSAVERLASRSAFRAILHARLSMRSARRSRSAAQRRDPVAFTPFRRGAPSRALRS